MDEYFEIPKWAREKISQAWSAELDACKDDLYVSYGWLKSDVSLRIMSDGEELKHEVYSLEDLCSEPAMHWHSSGKVSVENHKLISEIADKLQEQSERLRNVLTGLTVDTPTKSGIVTDNYDD